MAVRSLVGRDDVLGSVALALERALGGRGGVVLVAGEPGIGKTAVLEVVADRARQHEVPVAWATCWDGSIAPVFWPWTQLVRDIATWDPGATTRSADLLSPARADLGGTPDPAQRFDLFDGVLDTPTTSSRQAGLLAVIDDIHWADEASLALLHFVAAHLRRSRVLLLAAYRDSETSTSLEQLRRVAEVVVLAALGDDDTIALVDATAGRELRADVVADVVRRAGGNPLFAVELARLRGADRATVDGGVASPAPAVVTDVILGRIDALGEASRSMLDAAAILGSEVSLDILSRLVDDRHDVVSIVDDAVRANVLTPVPGRTAVYRFGHDLFREVLIATMPSSRVADLHIAAARAIEDMAARGIGTSSSSVAAHYVAATLAGRRDVALEAVARSQQAATVAVNQLAFEGAIAHLRRARIAVARAVDPPPDLHSELLLATGAAYDLTGDSAAAREAYLEAAADARRRGDAEHVARAAVGIHQLGARSGLGRDDNRVLLEEAVVALGGRDTASRARALASLARELHHTWDESLADDARAAASEAVAVARRVGDPATTGRCLLAAHDVDWSVGSASRRQPIAVEMTDLARQARDTELYAQARLLDATARLELGDPSALSELERYCRVADDLGHARGRWQAMSRRAVLALLGGRFDDARALGADAARLGAAIGEPDARGVWDTLRWELGRFDGGRDEIEDGDHWVPDRHWPPVRSLLHAEAGDEVAARAALTGYSVRRDRHHGVARHDGWVHAVVAEAVARSGDDTQRAEVYEWLRPLAGVGLVYGGCMGFGGAVDHHLGVLARALGRHGDADDHLRAGLAMHAAIGATPWVELDQALLDHVLLEEVLLDGRPAASVAPPVPGGATTNVLRREGETWRITFRDRTSTIRHVKGMSDLAMLLHDPGRELPAVELMGGVDVGSSGPVLDDEARRAYRTRVRDLQHDVDEARGDNDWARAERLEAELDALVGQLSAAFGLGGRTRNVGSSTERARVAVTHRIRSAIRRIDAADPALALHLTNAVRTGTWCSYRPDGEILWNVSVD